MVICYNTTQIEVPGGAVGNWVLLAAMQFKSQILEKLLSLQELARDTATKLPKSGCQSFLLVIVVLLVQKLQDLCRGGAGGPYGEAIHVESCQVSPPEAEAKVFSSRPHSSWLLSTDTFSLSVGKEKNT